MSAKREAPAWIQQQFEAFFATTSREPAWLRSLREDAWTRFVEAGVPTKKYEDWQYLSLKGLDAYGLRPTETRAALTDAQVASAEIFGVSARLVFVDGRYQADLSTPPSLPAGGYAGSLYAAIEAGGDREEQLRLDLTRLLDSRVKNPFTYVNMALFADGALLDIPAEAALDAPIGLFYLSTGREPDAAHHPRNIIRVGAGAKARFVEHYASLSSAESGYWSNPATAFFIAAGAEVEHIKLQREDARAFHLAQMHVEQGADSVLHSHLFGLGASRARHEVETVLQGEQIVCKLNGLYLADSGQHMDHRICMEHAQPHGMSDQYFKGVLSGEGSGAFSGRILVNQAAQKTDAYQSHQALLLSDDASVSSKPQLEIYADDVKCSHGATTGSIDEDALFYLQARGIPRLQAEHILVSAFGLEVLTRLQDEGLREPLEVLLAARLDELQDAQEKRIQGS